MKESGKEIVIKGDDYENFTEQKKEIDGENSSSIFTVSENELGLATMKLPLATSDEGSFTEKSSSLQSSERPGRPVE